jgi:3-mercaptopyruvate sulfurtransferase SseA
MVHEFSAVLEFGAPEPGEIATMMEDKLRFHTDSWDLSVDLKAALAGIVVIDARSRDAYIAGHIPGAVSFPHREMNAETVEHRTNSRGWDFAPRNCSGGSIGGAATGIQ